MDEFFINHPNKVSELQLKLKGKNTLWGLAPVAPIHLGYDSLILLQKKAIEEGSTHVVLLADLHAMMSHKLKWEDVDIRVNYWKFYLKEICHIEATYLRGSYFQTRPGYVEDLYSIISSLTVRKVKDRLPKVAKTEAFYVYQTIYPIMQCLDIFHTDAEIILAEEGQRKIYKLIEELHKSEIFRPWVNQRLRKDLSFIYIHTSHDINGEPLIKSKLSTRINVHETPDTLKKKINRMYAPPAGQQLEEGKVNALLEFFKFSVFPWFKEIRINTSKGERYYASYSEFENDYAKGEIHPADAKEALYKYIGERLKEIQELFKQGLTKWIKFEKLMKV